MTVRCEEIEFNLDGEEVDNIVENVPTFQYLGQPLDQKDDDWPDVRQNIMCARSVWGRLGTLLRREGVDTKVSASFYRAVVRAILLYGSETWVLLASIVKRIEGIHTDLLQMITGKRVNQLGDGTWETPGEEVIQEAAGTHSARMYVER